jgi:hypothetical protein
MALPYLGLLLGMQAAGAIMDYRSMRSQQKLIGVGRQLEQAAYETNLEAIRLEADEASLQAMKDLRQNIGTQIVTQAARGTSTAQGSAQMLMTQSTSQFENDERKRRMNLMAKEANLRANNVLSGLHTLQSETQLGQAFTQRLLNQIPTSEAFGEFRKTGFAKSIGFGLEEVKGS